MEPNKNMGELFRLNRSKHSKSSSNSNPPPPSLKTPSGGPTFADIQREQELEAAAAASSSRRGGFTGSRRRGTNDRMESGGGGGYYGTGGDRYESDRYGGRNDRYGGGARGSYRPDRDPYDDPPRYGGGGGRSRHRSLGPNLSELPIETGKIHTLLDNFGFIYCADRPGELFFHYSQVEGNPDDLNCEDEVSFHVGPSTQRGGGGGGEDKLAGYAVQVLEPGTVQWDVEEEPGVRKQGTIDRVSRRLTKGWAEGTIRLVVDHAESQEGEEGTPKKKNRPMVVRYSGIDLQEDENSSASTRGLLESKDLVEFTLVTNKRSGRKMARDIVLIQSERERLEEEREKKLLESATLEQGVVVALKDGFGFLKSNRRREEIYFHYSHICLPEDGDESAEEEHELREGQDMEFLVVHEPGKNRLSSRQIKFLEKGSVLFQQVLATGVTGMVSLCPRPPAQPSIFASRGKRKIKAVEAALGKVVLTKPLSFSPVEDKDSTIDIIDVTLKSEDCPGGILSLNRDGSKVGLWIREGDLISFDVVRDVVDGTCFATPTTICEANPEDNRPEKKRIQLLSPSLAGRAEGVISSIKDNFGFIQLADRVADIYFRLSDVFPDEIHQDTLNYSGDQTAKDDFQAPALTIGSHVTFDLSLQEPQGSANESRNRNSRHRNDKEQMRAQRLEIHCEQDILLSQVIGTGMKGKVIKIHSLNGFSGLIELDEEVNGMSPEERHPIIAKLLGRLVSQDVGSSIKFHDVQSEKEIKIIRDFISNDETLELSFVPVDEGDNHPSLICIKKIEKAIQSEKINTEDAPQSAEKEAEGEGGSKSDPDLKEDILSPENVHQQSDQEEDEKDSSSKKRKKNKHKITKIIKFDKQSLSPGLLKQPPGVGDIISCDVTFVRRTNAFVVSNLEVLERKSPELKSNSNTVKSTVQGYILMEPSHTSLSHTPSHAVSSMTTASDGGRWGQFVKEGRGKAGIKSKEEGLILMLRDESTDETIAKASTDPPEPMEQPVVKALSCIPYINSSAPGRSEASDSPKRCDLVCFSKGKGGRARDIRVLKRGAVEVSKGKLENINIESNSAKFLTTSGEYDISLSDVVSCEKTLLKESEPVEGILYDGKIYGVCRNSDLYLDSKLGSGLKERPKLNLTVKKELKGLGGKIIAQSGMAKGPDGTCGFHKGWTTRVSQYAEEEVQEEEENPESIESMIEKDEEVKVPLPEPEPIVEETQE